MTSSNALSMPLAVLLVSGTLSITPAALFDENRNIPFNIPIENFCRTTSLNLIAEKYGNQYRTVKPQWEALQLFGEQSNFLQDEKELYWSVLTQKSKNIRVNVFNLF